MKHKNITSVIHNFGHSFLSDMNYIDSGFLLDDLKKIRKKGYNIKIDWKTKYFSPKTMKSERITKSIEIWSNTIVQQFSTQNVDFDLISSFELYWEINQKPLVLATDNNGKLYKKEITKTF